METSQALAGRYQLTAHVARGGMADVFEASDLMLDRQVAVKILHPQFASTETFVARFRKEAQAAANLAHPNIVSIYDWGEDDGTYFIVMELIRGRSLREILKKEGLLLPRRAAEIAVEVASALEVAHRNRVIHRDNKPGNILLATDGTVKVTDFGVARAWDDSQELTRTGSVIGTATYFSPEQARGESADGRSDIYSLGVVLYEMLTGRPPFSGETPVSVAYQHVATEPPAPSLINPDVPAELDAIVGKALQKNPSDRYQSADEIRRDLLFFLRGEPAPVAVPPSSAEPNSAEAPSRVLEPGADNASRRSYTDLPPPTVSPEEAYRRMSPPRRRSANLPAIIGSVMVAAALVFGIYFLLNNLSNEAPPAATVPPPAVSLRVPDVAGLTEEEARRRLQEDGFRVTPVTETSETVEAGLVIRTEPRTGLETEQGAVVSIVVSAGPDLVAVPNVVGSTQQRAAAQLRGQGFAMAVEAANSEAGVGEVIAQSPAAGEDAPPGSVITLTVSIGPVPAVVPSVFGMSEERAVGLLEGQGFEVDIRRETSDQVEEGLVSAQNPAADSEAPPGSQVEITVSQGRNTVVVPDLADSAAEQAAAVLEELGLVVEVVQENHPEAGAGQVIRTDPPAESEVALGGRVTLVESIGPAIVNVPELTGLTLQEAAEQLELLGLGIEAVGTSPVTDVALADTVVEQNPGPDTEAARGQVVTVSLGTYEEPEEDSSGEPAGEGASGDGQ